MRAEDLILPIGYDDAAKVLIPPKVHELRSLTREISATPMIEVYRIPVPKDVLAAMPKEERALLLLLGYVSNQLSTLMKIVQMSMNGKPSGEADQIARAVQTQLLLRLTIGALNEGYELISKRFTKSSIQPQYLPLLDAEGREALNSLKKQFGSSNLLSQIRTHYAFHHPSNDDIEAAFQAAYNDGEEDKELWQFYFSHHGYNSLFLISDLIFVHGIGRRVGEGHPKETHPKLMDEVVPAALNVMTFARAFASAAWRKYFGSEMLATGVVKIANAPSIDVADVPFFVEIDRDPS